jgi:hypothetical protein
VKFIARDPRKRPDIQPSSFMQYLSTTLLSWSFASEPVVTITDPERAVVLIKRSRDMLQREIRSLEHRIDSLRNQVSRYQVCLPSRLLHSLIIF